MQLIGSFFQFTQRVMDAVRLGKLPKEDSGKLSRLLKRTGKKNLILAKGILTALSAGGASHDDIQSFSKLLEKANERIVQEKDPFTEIDKKDLTDIFKRAYVSSKVVNWFASQMDELLAEEIEEFIKGKRSLGVPTKSVAPVEKDEKPKKIKM